MKKKGTVETMMVGATSDRSQAVRQETQVLTVGGGMAIDLSRTPVDPLTACSAMYYAACQKE